MWKSKPLLPSQKLNRHVEHADYGVSAPRQIMEWGRLLSLQLLSPSGAGFDGSSVVVATTEQLTTVAAMVALDGIARRIVLYPADLPLDHLAYVAQSAEADFVVSDRATRGERIGGALTMGCDTASGAPKTFNAGGPRETEWVLLTSGTTGLPKLVVHSLNSLAGAIAYDIGQPRGVVWSTFYDIRRYGGLQIFLRAALTGTSLVLADARESTTHFLTRAAAKGVTHISGTPTQWRRALMSSAAHSIMPVYIRLSGEIADQGILDQLRLFYPKARISHAFASTEAGVAFEVKDGLAGFALYALNNTPGVHMKVEDGTLRIRSDRAAACYLNHTGPPLKGGDGFVNTGDMVERINNRYYFVGRQDGVINVGGLKVHPEEVEAVLNEHPRVSMSLVRMKKSPITGALVTAEVVLQSARDEEHPDNQEMQEEILSFCRQALPTHKVPVSIKFVPSLAVAETGKLVRNHA